MATQSPFLLLANGFFSQVGANLKPPPWLINELRQRLVLLLNHVLMQEPQAQERLVRHKGRCVRMQWRDFTLPFVATPAGLLEIAPDALQPDLMLTVMSRDFDPRSGEVIYRLQNVKRGEPDAALMRLPADYTAARRAERSASG